MPLPDQITLELEAIDAALAGDRVDPEFAELVELALLLADSRPALAPAAASRLDVRVSGLASDPRTRRRVAKAHREPRRSWILRPAFGAGLAGFAAVVVAVVILSGGGGSSGPSVNSAVGGRAKAAAATHATAASDAPTSSGSSGGASSSDGAITRTSPAKKQALPALSPLSAASTTTLSAPSGLPTPAASGQKIVQSSQLSLIAPSDRIDQVSQELFDVVGAEQGIVKRSSVTAGNGGYGSFTLAIPTANLSATLARLASLKYSRVSSSTESTTDVTDTYQDDQRTLADAKALHTSLLKQLAAADTSEQVDSLDAQITDNESAISADEKALNGLQSSISYTSVSVQINAGTISSPPGKPTGSSGFSLHQAGHDALRILVVVAGVVLIALAVLVPLALVVALIAWLASRWRRRRREAVLDAA